MLRVRKLWSWLIRPRKASLNLIYDPATVGVGLVTTRSPFGVALLVGPVTIEYVTPKKPLRIGLADD